MGNYHPHGDAAIYEALVRLAQDWVMRVPLVHGQGNFGSVDGDPPAAYRYTEAKLTAVAEHLLSELRPGDGRTAAQLRRQPPGAGRPAGPVPEPAGQRHLRHRRRHGDQHPAAQPRRGHPRLHPPHRQPGRDRRPSCSTSIKGPDFPLGGKIVTDRDHAAQDLRGRHRHASRCRANGSEEKPSKTAADRHHVDPLRRGQGRSSNRPSAHIIEERKLPQLLGLTNESNEKDGLRIALEIKPDTDPNLVMAYLYKHTDVAEELLVQHDLPGARTTTASVRPERLGLKDDPAALPRFPPRRRCSGGSSTSWNVLRKRIHILEGFKIIFNALDRAIKMIREIAAARPTRPRS